ncbi:MAG TPA: globin family protein [Gemmatimonadales bacterium]|jgi:hemoglobin-like flavoprotein|nr:globin family protein [Gemmatimonadales bacterium]
MRPETEQIVRDSWAQFEPVAVESAAFFYAKLFELDPDAERLFATTDMVAQGHKVMRMFAEIVHNLDRPETLVAEVADLGRRHVGYGVQDHQYDSVGIALLWTLERGLGPAFTDEVRNAWTEAYLLLSTVARRATARASHPRGHQAIP